MTQEALKLAIEALYPIAHNTTDDPRGQAYKAITAIKEALAQQEPVKWSDYEPDGMHHNKPQKRPQNCGTGYCSCIECVMETPQRTWVGLTKEQLATTDWSADFRAGALWAEAKLKEKNT